MLFMDFIFVFKVNPPTAYNMLRDYVELREGDWVMQNGANSAVRISVFFASAPYSVWFYFDFIYYRLDKRLYRLLLLAD
jgi:hypothetical protein